MLLPLLLGQGTGGSSDGSASGLCSNVNITSANATASGSGQATGSCNSVNITAANGAASGTAQAVGACSSVNITAANATASGTQAYESLWPSNPIPGITNNSDTAATEVGVRFTSDVPKQVYGAKWYKGTNDTGTHTITLWSSTGTVLGQVVASGETATGWQVTLFSSPVAIYASTTYEITRNSPNGGFALSSDYFDTSGVDTGDLHAPSVVNGRYKQPASTPSFPDNAFGDLGNNYWVDPLVLNSSGDGSATGLCSTVNVTAASGIASGTAQATGTCSNVSITAANASANGTAQASGTCSSVNITAANASANGTAQASGACSTVNITAANATASGTAQATGVCSTVNITAANATASGTSGGADGNATGACSSVNITSANATASGTAQASAACSTVTVSAATGSANSSGTPQGACSTVTISAATGTASGTIGSIDGNASGNCNTVFIIPAEATATGTGGNQVVVDVRGAGKKSSKKKPLTHADRKEIDEKVFKALFDLSEKVAEKADISKEYVTKEFVEQVVVAEVPYQRIMPQSYYEEIAKLQTELILRKLRDEQELDDEESLLALL